VDFLFGVWFWREWREARKTRPESEKWVSFFFDPKTRNITGERSDGSRNSSFQGREVQIINYQSGQIHGISAKSLLCRPIHPYSGIFASTVYPSLYNLTSFTSYPSK
jgi:hypothetical protein